MKKKVWAASPVFFVITAVMFVITGISWFYNPAVFKAELVLSFAATAAVVLAVLQFRSYISFSVKAAQQMLTGEEYRSLQQFTLPVAAIGKEGDILWLNDALASALKGGKEYRGENILKLIYPHTMEQLIETPGTDVSIGERMFTVFAAQTEYGWVLCFVDDTYYKTINRKYAESQPVVAIAHFDNREELARDATSGEEARIASDVESALTDWTQQMGGFLKRLSGGKFLIVTDELHIHQAIEHRFEILDTIRGIKAGGRRSATVSIGVGRGASTLLEAEEWARKALEMALGRGGDQVALKQRNDTYEFFGGLSKGVEKRDKVRTRVIAATLSDNIKASDTVLIMGHRFSDLDAVGSAVGLWSVITKSLKKQAFIVINRQQSLASTVIDGIAQENQDKRVFIAPADAMPFITAKTMLIVVDTHSPDFVESKEVLQAVSRVVVIDHHRLMVEHIENSLVFYHEPYASSASEMVTELVQYIGDHTVTQLEAEALLAGIMLDTKNFVLKTGVRTFEAAAYLRRRGADTVEVKRLFSGNLDTYKAKYQLVSTAEIIHECAISYVVKEFPNVRVTCAQAADELLSIQGVKASFVLFPAGDVINISARSLGDINVQLIMEQLGGGGHLTMAAAQLPDVTIDQAKDVLLTTLEHSQAFAAAQNAKPATK